MLPPNLIESALESAPDAIVISDARGTIVFANRQAGTLFGYERHELLDRAIEQLLPERLHARHVGHRTEFILEPRARPMGTGLELYGRRKDGTEFPVEISLSPIGEGGGRLVAAAIRDVTERHRIQKELIAARQAAEAARDAADRANEAKSRFLATASHDLRQPLQSLTLLNGTLRRMVAHPDVREALIQQEQSIGAMTRLLNALLDISKLESGAVTPEITDFAVASLFEELRREFAAVAVTKGLELQVESCEHLVHSDRSLLEQVLRNLVSNAIKYTRRGRVLLRCLCEPAVVRLEVLDTGIGMAPHQLPYIFDEFFQIGVKPNVSRDGYGLGLSIVSRIVRLLGLKLDVESAPGEGSSFRLEVPASGSRGIRERDPAIVLEWESGQAKSAIPICILLVEDDAGVRNATRLLLRSADYDVITAESRADALRRLDQDPRLDLLVTDFHLGDGSGVEVIAYARERLGSGLPAILLSGDTSAHMRELAHDDRWRIASKPLQAERLLALIEELLIHIVHER